MPPRYALFPTAEEPEVRRAIDIIDGANLNALSGRILGATYDVHTALGPGLLESAYEACLAHELRS